MTIPVLIIPVLNRFDLLEMVLDSIDYPVENILIVDNSNSYKTSRENVHVLNMPSNLGVAASWNLGIKLFPHSDYWVIGSNDTIWLPNAMKDMHDSSDSDSLVMSNEAWNTFSIGTNIVKEIGLFDENYYPAYCEDTDYMERMRLHNINNKIKWTSIQTKCMGSSMTMNSNDEFLKRNEYTGPSNWQYYLNKIYSSDSHYDCYKWDLQRRINQDWGV